MTNEEAKKILEVLLFSNDKPLNASILSDVLEEKDSKVNHAFGKTWWV